MKKVKIVADSSSDLTALQGVDFSLAPLKIIAGETEFVDDIALDVSGMIDFLDKYKGRSSTSCPNPEEWIRLFEDADEIYCVTITGALSGSYNAACSAKRMYEEQYPERHVCVIDSRSTGPEMALILRKLAEWVCEGRDFVRISGDIAHYQSNTGLLFVLESMKNLANNGRVSRLAAKFAGLMGIRVVGKASEQGTLEPLDKPRGEKLTLQRVMAHLTALGYSGGRLHITHCQNEGSALELKHLILQKFANAEILIGQCRGLCSFYAEKGGMLIGFEKQSEAAQ